MGGLYGHAMSDDGMRSVFDETRHIRKRRLLCQIMIGASVLGVCGILYLLLGGQTVESSDCGSVLTAQTTADRWGDRETADPAFVFCHAAHIQRLGWALLVAVPTTMLGVTGGVRWPRER